MQHFKGQHSKSALSRSKRANESNNDIDEQKIAQKRCDMRQGHSQIEKAQAISIDRSNIVKKLKILEGSGLNNPKIAFKYSREGIDYDVPELGYPKNSSIFKRREKSIDYSPRSSAVDGMSKEYFRHMLIAPTKPLRPNVNKVPKFFR